MPGRRAGCAARPYSVTGNELLRSTPPGRTWPGPELPGRPLPGRDAVGCTVVTGAGADRIRAAARDANVATPWTWNHRRWQVILRPLLPDESTCADLLPPA